MLNFERAAAESSEREESLFGSCCLDAGPGVGSGVLDALRLSLTAGTSATLSYTSSPAVGAAGEGEASEELSFALTDERCDFCCCCCVRGADCTDAAAADSGAGSSHDTAYGSAGPAGHWSALSNAAAPEPEPVDWPAGEEAIEST